MRWKCFPRAADTRAVDVEYGVGVATVGSRERGSCRHAAATNMHGQGRPEVFSSLGRPCLQLAEGFSTG